MTAQLIKCAKCGQFDGHTSSATRCNDCCVMRRRDISGRLLASRCAECCPTGHGKHAAIGTTLVELSEVAELAAAVQSNIEGRLLAVETPQQVLEHAERLDDRANEWREKANSIREALIEDSANEMVLIKEMARAFCIQQCCANEMRRGVRKITKGYIDSVVDKFLKQTFGG